MDPKRVRKLEKELRQAIDDALRGLGRKRLPRRPSQHTLEMMAKAAAAVYEATADDRAPRR